MLRSRSQGVFRLATVSLLVAVVSGCTDSVRPPQSTAEPAPVQAVARLMEPCGASFRVTMSEERPEMDDTYTWGPQTDTVDICETWVGDDYRWSVRTVGTSEREGGIYDMARDGAYDANVLYTAEEGSIVQAEPVGSTIFGALNTDESQIQASYDDPCYGVTSGGGCPGGCEFLMADPSGANGGSSQPGDTLFKRHGIARRGVRALVESRDEIGRSPEGYRRFRKADSKGEHFFLVHPTLDLLMGEEFRDDKIEMSSRNEWTPGGSGFVRSKTSVETRERFGRRKVQYRATMLISNLKIGPR